MSVKTTTVNDVKGSAQVRIARTFCRRSARLHRLHNFCQGVETARLSRQDAETVTLFFQVAEKATRACRDVAREQRVPWREGNLKLSSVKGSMSRRLHHRSNARCFWVPGAAVSWPRIVLDAVTSSHRRVRMLPTCLPGRWRPICPARLLLARVSAAAFRAAAVVYWAVLAGPVSEDVAPGPVGADACRSSARRAPLELRGAGDVCFCRRLRRSATSLPRPVSFAPTHVLMTSSDPAH